jgi:hypothetical protein
VEGRGGDGGSKGEDGDGGSQGVGLAKRELGRRVDVDGMKKLTRFSPGHVFKRVNNVTGGDKPARPHLLLQVFRIE